MTRILPLIVLTFFLTSCGLFGSTGGSRQPNEEMPADQSVRVDAAAPSAEPVPMGPIDRANMALVGATVRLRVFTWGCDDLRSDYSWDHALDGWFRELRSWVMECGRLPAAESMSLSQRLETESQLLDLMRSAREVERQLLRSNCDPTEAERIVRQLRHALDQIADAVDAFDPALGE